MLIGLIGPTSSGKLEVAKYLIVHHNFRPAFISSKYIHGQGQDQGSSSSSFTNQDQFSFERRWQELVTLCQDREQQNSNNSNSSSSLSTTSNGNKPFLFKDCQTLLDHATFNWLDNVVTLDLTSRKDLEIGFDKRPFFLLIGIDAPVSLRWRRTLNKNKEELKKYISQDENEKVESSSLISLEEFTEKDDANLYGLDRPMNSTTTNTMNGKFNLDSLPSTPSKMPQRGMTSSMNGLSIQERLAETPPLTTPIGNSTMFQVVQPNGNLVSRAGGGIGGEEDKKKPSSTTTPTNLRELMQSCSMIIQNNFKTIANFHSHLSSLHLSSSQRLRPSWDTYFLSLCTLASLRSNCMKRRVGAVLVRNNRVLSTGYNGTPRGLKNCSEGGCSRCNGAAAGGTALDECLCLHAEENALLECGRERGGAEGTVLYCNTCPCLRCAVKIVQTGVREVVYQLAYSMDDRSRMIFQEANVLFRQYHPL